MASSVARAYNGGLEARATSGVQGQSPWSGNRVKHFWFLDAQRKPQICPFFYNLETQRNEILVLFLQTSNLSTAHERATTLAVLFLTLSWSISSHFVALKSAPQPKIAKKH